MKTIPRITVALTLACVAGLGQAQEGATALPQAQTQNGITFVCGGVGSEEATQMKQAASQYDLMLTFATKTGNFLSDVQVDIADARGRTVLNTVCDGPIMLVEIPRDGRYIVRGALAGHVVSGVAQLRSGTRGKPLHLVLPDGGGTES